MPFIVSSRNFTGQEKNFWTEILLQWWSWSFVRTQICQNIDAIAQKWVLLEKNVVSMNDSFSSEWKCSKKNESSKFRNANIGNSYSLTINSNLTVSLYKWLFYLSRDYISSIDQKIKWLCAWRLLIVSNHRVKFGSHKHCGNRYKAFFIHHVTIML